MDLNDTKTATKVGVALFVQLLNKLIDKGILTHDDVTEMNAAAAKTLKDPNSGDAFSGLAERLAKEFGEN